MSRNMTWADKSYAKPNKENQSIQHLISLVSPESQELNLPAASEYTSYILQVTQQIPLTKYYKYTAYYSYPKLESAT